MSKTPSPFAGIKLSDVTAPTTPVDQLLFRSTQPPPPAQAAEPPEDQPQVATKRPTPPVPGKAALTRSPAVPTPATGTNDSFDLAAVGYVEKTIRITEEENALLKQINFELDTKFGLSNASVNDIFRHGLHLIFAEYPQHKEQSTLVTRLRKKYR